MVSLSRRSQLLHSEHALPVDVQHSTLPGHLKSKSTQRRTWGQKFSAMSISQSLSG